MFLDRRLLNEELNALHRIAVKETCVINVAEVGPIGQTIVTMIARFARVDAHHVKHFIQPFESSVGQSQVADVCHHMVLEKLVNSSSVQVFLDAPVC